MTKATISILLVHGIAYCALAALWPPQAKFMALVLAAVFVWISVVDFLSLEIPDTGWLLVLALGLYHSHMASELHDAMLAGLIWPLGIFVAVKGHAWLRGFTGLGFGDVKLMAGVAVWAGLTGTIWVVMIAALSGIAAILLLALARRRSLKEASTNLIAFGPFLCFSCWAVILHEGRI